jgi:hypothetical protein
MISTVATPLVTSPVLIFFIVLVIILLSPVVLNRFKIPHIIGLIVAGVAIGPHGLNVLARDMSFELFGQVGILYIMFLAGIEIDMYHLKRNLKRGMFFGLLTFLFPMIVGTLASVYILKMNWVTSILLASMYASHTLISYPIVARFGLTKNPAVLIAVVGTIIAVIGALLVLAGAMNVHRTGDFAWADLLRLLLELAIYCIVILYTYPRITRWFFKNHSDNVTQYIFVMAMVFLASWFAQIIELEAVLGAFFAGLVLNRYVPNASPLMNRIEFLGNATLTLSKENAITNNNDGSPDGWAKLYSTNSISGKTNKLTLQADQTFHSIVAEKPLNIILENDAKLFLVGDCENTIFVEKGQRLNIYNFKEDSIYVGLNYDKYIIENRIVAYTGTDTSTMLDKVYVSSTGWLTALPAVPEPAEWAMIFGAIALGFAIYRRRK